MKENVSQLVDQIDELSIPLAIYSKESRVAVFSNQAFSRFTETKTFNDFSELLNQPPERFKTLQFQDGTLCSFSTASFVFLFFLSHANLMGLLSDIPHINRLLLLGKISGKVSHEFNNILTGLLAQLEVAKSQIDYDTFTLLSETAQKAVVLTREIASFSKPSSEEEKIDFSDFCKKLKSWCSLLIPKNIKFEIKTFSVASEFFSNKLKLQQIIFNTILNSVDAIKASGLIVLELDLSKDQLKIVVTDNGEGIAPENIRRVFEPYFTTKAQGIGLGCYVLKEIVTSLGGTIDIKSELQKGTTVTVLIPVKTEKKISSARVLVVDDDDSVREVLKKGLFYSGFDVEAASGHQEALEWVTKKKFDLVLMDIIMPEVGGFETTKMLLEKDKDLAFVVMSGYSPPETLEAFANLGIKTFLQKPFSLDELVLTLKKVLNEKA